MSKQMGLVHLNLNRNLYLFMFFYLFRLLLLLLVFHLQQISCCVLSLSLYPPPPHRAPPPHTHNGCHTFNLALFLLLSSSLLFCLCCYLHSLPCCHLLWAAVQTKSKRDQSIPLLSEATKIKGWIQKQTLSHTHTG